MADSRQVRALTRQQIERRLSEHLGLFQQRFYAVFETDPLLGPAWTLPDGTIKAPSLNELNTYRDEVLLRGMQAAVIALLDVAFGEEPGLAPD